MESRDDFWWLGDALADGPRGLELDGLSLADVANQHGTPIYVYRASVIRRRIAELRSVLAGIPHRIHFAMKANRYLPVLEVIRAEGIGIDTCSPREVARALEVGFSAEQISFTAGMLSNADLRQLVSQGVHLNLDTRSAMRRYAALEPRARNIGLRIDPGVRVGWGDDPKLSYGSSKFGFDFASVLQAAAYAQELGLEVDTLHMHAGWNVQAKWRDELASVYQRLAELARALPSVRTLNVGGGLGVRHRAEDDPLAPDEWGALIREHLAPSGCTIACEPGTFLVAQAGVLLAQVNTVEERHSGTWIGIDVGHNVNVYAAHYGIPLIITPVAQPLAKPTRVVHVGGNINEANDVFARSLPFPDVAEGDVVALHPAGAYGASMASDHCMRGLPREVLA
ncbi:MAG: diaminopimelate decarboxylase [Polyangiales bacterium]